MIYVYMCIFISMFYFVGKYNLVLKFLNIFIWNIRLKKYYLYYIYEN